MSRPSEPLRWASAAAPSGGGGGSSPCGHDHSYNNRQQCLCPTPGEEEVHFPEVWNELRVNQQLCDGAILCGDGKRLKIHRAILSAVSPYFTALFTQSLCPDQSETREVSMSESEEALRPILDYAYTGRCMVSARNVEQLLPLADRLGVLGVVQQCCHFLLREMQPDNCLGIFRFASSYFCQELEANGRRYILHNFRKILRESAELCGLSCEELCSLLSDDGLNARSEELVFEAVSRWVDCDVEGRRKYLPDLLACVRLGLTSVQFLDDTVLAYGPIKNDEALQEALQPIRAFLARAKVNDGGIVDLTHPLARPRVPYEILFAIGGWSAGEPTNMVETYDCRANRWCLSVNRDPQPRAYHGLVELEGLVYMIGGSDGVKHYNTVRSYNPVTREWREQACMYQARCYVSVCTLGGKIYAIGGFDGRTRMSSAETYDPQQNQWRLIPQMNIARSDASAASLNGKVYVAGGFDGKDVLRSAEVFDLDSSQWSLIPCMLSPRSGLSLVEHRGCLYALGGYSGIERLCSGERFDPLAGRWQPIHNMLHPRSNFAAAILDDLIFVIGGFNGAIMSNTECLDIEANEWKEAQQMSLNRSGLAAVVIAGLPTAEDYSYLHVLHPNHSIKHQ